MIYPVVKKNVRFKTSMLKSDLCDYSDAYVVVKGTIDLLAAATNEINKAQKDVVFKNNAPFRSCISNINNILIDNAEGLDIFMSMYNLLEYIDNYSIILETLWNYYRDEIDVDDDASESKSCRQNAKIIGKTPAQP